MISFIKQHAVVFVAVFIVVLLIAKFFYSLFVFDVPLGFDPGMYRYLFVKYAREFPPFSLPDLRPWAQEYPFGLFIITSYLIKAGIPMDYLMLRGIFMPAGICFPSFYFARMHLLSTKKKGNQQEFCFCSSGFFQSRFTTVSPRCIGRLTCLCYS